MIGIAKHRMATIAIFTPPVGSGVQIGKAVITSDSYWSSSDGTVGFTLLPVGVAFSDTEYPELALVYPSLVTPTLSQEVGSPFPYQIVGGLQ